MGNTIPIVLVLVGSILLYIGVKSYRDYKLVADSDVTPIRELRDPGPVEIEGTVTEDSETIQPALADDEGVLAGWKVEDWSERGDHSHWQEKQRGIEAAEFTVTDDSNETLTVDIPDDTLSPLSWRALRSLASRGVQLGRNCLTIGNKLVIFQNSLPIVQTASVDDEGRPDDVETFEANHDIDAQSGSVTNILDMGNKHGDRRFSLQMLKPGDDVYLFGRVEANGGDGHGSIPLGEAVLRPLDDGTLIVSTIGEEAFESRRKKIGLIGVGVGLSLLAAGAYLLL